MKRFFLLLILLAASLLRLQRFDFPASYTFAWGDGTRDFIVANHILKYGEIPLVGPYNLLNDAGIYNSPVYFYILALFLTVSNHILTLSLVGILISLVVIVLIFLLTKKLFDYHTAIITVLLFSFNPEIIKQADFVWQPYLMLPLALLSLYFFWSRRLFSLILLCLASTIHNSSFPWLAVFFLYPKRSLKQYGRDLVIVTGLLAIFHLPLILFYLKNGFPNHLQNFPLYINSLVNYLVNFKLNLTQILSTFYLNNLLIIFLLVGLVMLLRKDQQTRRIILFICLLLTSSILFASFFNKFKLHYLILSLPLLAILVARVVNLFQGSARWMMATLLMIIMLGNFAYLNEFKQPLQNQKRVEMINQRLINELEEVKKSQGYSDFDFFQLTSFANSEITHPYPVLDTFWAVPLEEKLSRQLIKVSDLSAYNHVQLNRADYLIVSCFKLAQAGQDCLKFFQRGYPDYHILKMLYDDESVSIYLARK